MLPKTTKKKIGDRLGRYVEIANEIAPHVDRETWTSLDKACIIAPPVSGSGLSNTTESVMSRNQKSLLLNRTLNLLIDGTLPGKMSINRFRAGIIPILDDMGADGEIIYKGFTTMNDGTRCFTFAGYCPVHHRNHSHATWQIKQHPRRHYSIFKCWRDDKFIKQNEINELSYYSDKIQLGRWDTTEWNRFRLLYCSLLGLNYSNVLF